MVNEARAIELSTKARDTSSSGIALLARSPDSKVSCSSSSGSSPGRLPSPIVLQEEPRKPKLKVTWNEINGACAELMEFEVSIDSIAKLPSFSEAPERSSCQTCRNCFKQMCHKLGFGDRTQMHGYLWKLNNEATVEDMACLQNWRRRLFFLQKKKTRICLSYISEKENGCMQMACLLSRSGWNHFGRTSTRSNVTTMPRAAMVSAPPPLEVEAATEDTKRKVCDAMHSYDLAFADGAWPIEEYTQLIPRQLFVIEVKWTDDHGDKQTTTLGSTSERADRKSVV